MARIKLAHVNSFADRYGQVRHYVRRRGQKAIRLPGLPGSDEFMAAYASAVAGLPDDKPGEIGTDRTLPGTINALVVSYFRSDAWQMLAEETRKTRRRTIERFRVAHGDKRVGLLQRAHVEIMLSAAGGLSAKRDWLKAIKGLLQSAVPIMIKANPADGIASIKLPKTRGHHDWLDEEITKYRAYWPLGSQQRLVQEFALETASRRGEVVRLGPQHINDGRIRIERTHGSSDVNIPMSPELQAACDAMPRSHLTFIVTAHGKPRSKLGLGNDFAKWATEAGLPARCRLHGLKKSGMRRLAEDGATAHELMAISGHRTLSEVQRYTVDANMRLLADSAMQKRTFSQEICRQDRPRNVVRTRHLTAA